MIHIKSSFYFESGENVWRVDYQDKPGNYGINLSSQVYLNDELYWEFLDVLSLVGGNPTKSQASKVIVKARKFYKEFYKVRDDREKKIRKVLKD